MITLRHLVASDKAIATITSEDCRLIGNVLDLVNQFISHWFFRFFVPKAIKEHALKVRMLAAVLSRTPEERVPLKEQIRLAMQLGLGKKETE